MHKTISWRKVANRYGINVRYVYELGSRGIEPTNPEIRKRLGLSAKCPKCKRSIRIIDQIEKPKVKRINWKNLADELYKALDYLLNKEKFLPGWSEMKVREALHHYEQAKGSQ